MKMKKVKIKAADDNIVLIESLLVHAARVNMGTIL